MPSSVAAATAINYGIIATGNDCNYKFAALCNTPQGSLGDVSVRVYVVIYCFLKRKAEGRQVADPYGGLFGCAPSNEIIRDWVGKCKRGKVKMWMLAAKICKKWQGNPLF